MKKKLITVALSSALVLSTVSVGISENLVQASKSSSSQHTKSVENLIITTKQSQTNAGEYIFTAVNPQGNVTWSVDGHNLGVSGNILTHKFTTLGSHKVEARWIKKLPYTGGVKTGSGSTIVNVKIIGPTQATWTVDPSIGTTATAIAAKFNSAVEKKTSTARFTVTAEGNQLHFVCNPGTFMTSDAANLPVGSKIETNKVSGTINEAVPGVEYLSTGPYKGLEVSILGYGQAQNGVLENGPFKPYEWSINCLKPQATQATYTVDPSTGTTAAGVVHELYNYNPKEESVSGIGIGISSVVAKGNHIVYTCKPGYHISEVAANLPVGGETDKNGPFVPSAKAQYPVVEYSESRKFYDVANFDQNHAFNGAPVNILGIHRWGVSCIK
ncbi:hypothetical protein [Francisella sp. 19X1-34]|uniref:hypothetical protein n=1 Tax=Francisella sp. 19X1-34 TaxID=3087177 RepID=UPI002E30BDCE|nr:hypothetical protein [Francisella sp. 19X1-34]MED7788498.1 hypothetical protein [Francisella sp. 19X1-34]